MKPLEHVEKQARCRPRHQPVQRQAADDVARHVAFAALRPIRSDFVGNRWLCADLRVTDAPLDLVISVRTAAPTGGTTYIAVRRRYAVGAHLIRLDLAALTPHGHPVPLDLSDVRSVIFFLVRPPEPRTVVLSRVWLEP